MRVAGRQACLDPLLTQTFHHFEVVLVDNGSEHGALDGLYEKHPAPDLHIHRLSSNLGFAAANNTGAGLARGNHVALKDSGIDLGLSACPHSTGRRKCRG